jgi:hypothetical protein
MKYSFSCILMLSCLMACDEKTQQTDDPTPEEPIAFQEVNADVSDVEVARQYSFDIHVDGAFDYEENYYYTLDGKFDLTFPFYKASYDAGSMPVTSPRIHSSLMCRTNNCDTSGLMMSGAWYRYDVKPVRSSFVWKFITTDTKNGYKVTMNELPKEIKTVGTIGSLSTTSDNVIEFEYNGTDSLLLALLAIPKDNLNGTTPPGPISKQMHFSVKAKNNRFVIPGKMVDQASVHPTDTAFINLISMKRVFKVIEGKKVAINYRKNHLYPIVID